MGGPKTRRACACVRGRAARCAEGKAVAGVWLRTPARGFSDKVAFWWYRPNWRGIGSRVAMRSVRLGAGLMQPLGYGRMQRRLSFLIRENDRQPCQISGLRVQRTCRNKTHPTALVGWALYECLTIHPRGRNTEWASLSLIVRRNRQLGQLLKGWRHRRDRPSISP